MVEIINVVFSHEIEASTARSNINHFYCICIYCNRYALGL